MSKNEIPRGVYEFTPFYKWRYEGSILCSKNIKGIFMYLHHLSCMMYMK